MQRKAYNVRRRTSHVARSHVARVILLLVAGSCACGGKELSLTLAAGPAETAAACVARAFTARLNEEHPEQHATVLRTNGAVESLLALRDGRTDLAIVTADTLARAVNGEDPFDGRTVSARTIATLYTCRLHLLVLEGTPINGFSQLRNHTIGVGPDGSGMELTVTRALDAALLGGHVVVEAHQWPDLLQRLDRGDLQALAWVDGLPSPAVAEATAAQSRPLRLLSSASVVPLLDRRYGDSLYEQAGIPQAVYGIDPSDGLGVSAVLVARHDLDDITGFTITSALFRLAAPLADSCPAVQGLTPSTAVRSQPAALHAGAALFYRESGNDGRR